MHDSGFFVSFHCFYVGIPYFVASPIGIMTKLSERKEEMLSSHSIYNNSAE